MMNSTDAKKQKQTPASDKPQPLCMIFVIFQSLSHVQLSVTPWTAAHQASLSFTISRGVERALGTLDATHKVPRNPGLPREEH